VWFAILPLRGKVLPANGNGHELSVFIGPILFYLVWKYRQWIRENLPADMGYPLLVVSVASIVLGMGSLKVLHVPVWMSPFDVLRPLPGFRSLGVTGRYWGFLALPLSLFGAVALWKYASRSNPHSQRRVQLVLGLTLVVQLAFQAETLSRHWFDSPRYPTAMDSANFRGAPEQIDYVSTMGRLQGQLITPTRGVCDCYDMDDFTRAERPPGAALVAQTTRDKQPWDGLVTRAEFMTWSHIHLAFSCVPPAVGLSCLDARSTRIQWVLGQAYHPYWHVNGCEVHPASHGNLMIDCPLSQLRQRQADVVFDDPESDSGARLSLLGWKIWGFSCLLLMAVYCTVRLLPARYVPIDSERRLLFARQGSVRRN
jgi:hypothetical protein